MSPTRWRILRLVAGVVLLAVVLAALDPAELWRALAGADLAVVLIAVVGLSAMHMVPAAGWRAMVHAVSGVAIPWPATLQLSYAAQAVGGVTPANLGGDVVRAAAVRAAGHGWSMTVLPILAQRATSYVALSALSVPALALLASQTSIASGVVVTGVAAAILVAVAASLLVAAPAPVRRIIGKRWPRFSPEAGAAHLPRRTLAMLAGIGLVSGLAFHAGSLALTWFLLAGVDPATATLPVLAALTVARLSLAVPLTPSGVGIQEAVVVALVASFSGPTEAVLAGLLLARLSLVLTTILGATMLATGRSGLGLSPSR
ncbi:MAG: lysylphosphatidylglycerol synthase transmembrane domain-containing protein [Chloroflexota bacterium]